MPFGLLAPRKIHQKAKSVDGRRGTSDQISAIVLRPTTDENEQIQVRILSLSFRLGSSSFNVVVYNDVFGSNWPLVQGFDVVRVGIDGNQRACGARGRDSEPKTLVGHTSNTD